MTYFTSASYASIRDQSPPHPLNSRQFRTNPHYCHNQSPSWLGTWFTKGNTNLALNFWWSGWAHQLKMPPGRTHGDSPKHPRSSVLEDNDTSRGRERYEILGPTPIYLYITVTWATPQQLAWISVDVSVVCVSINALAWSE